MNESYRAEGGTQLVAEPRCWPRAEKSERRESQELFELIHKDVHADDKLLKLLASDDPREKLISVLTAMKLAIYTPHRWSPDDRGGEEKPKREPGQQLEVLTALEAIFGDSGQPLRLRAATVIAIGEIERHLTPTRKRKHLFTSGFDPHATYLVGWLTPDDPARMEVALWALSLIAPLYSTRTVEMLCDTLTGLVLQEQPEAVWAAAGKLAAGLGKRAKSLTPALVSRLTDGAGDAGCELIEALLAIDYDPADRDTIMAALDKLLRTVTDRRRLWLCVLKTRSFERTPDRFLETLQQIAAANDEPAALLARSILSTEEAAELDQSTRPSASSSHAPTGVRELSCAPA